MTLGMLLCQWYLHSNLSLKGIVVRSSVNWMGKRVLIIPISTAPLAQFLQHQTCQVIQPTSQLSSHASYHNIPLGKGKSAIVA